MNLIHILSPYTTFWHWHYQKKWVELLSVLVYDKKKLSGVISKDETSKKGN